MASKRTSSQTAREDDTEPEVHPAYDPNMLRKVLIASPDKILKMHRRSRQRHGMEGNDLRKFEGHFKMF